MPHFARSTPPGRSVLRASLRPPPGRFPLDQPLMSGAVGRFSLPASACGSSGTRGVRPRRRARIRDRPRRVQTPDGRVRMGSPAGGSRLSGAEGVDKEVTMRKLATADDLDRRIDTLPTVTPLFAEPDGATIAGIRPCGHARRYGAG